MNEICHEQLRFARGNVHHSHFAAAEDKSAPMVLM